MTARLSEIKAMQELDSLMTDSATRPVVIFKHSNSCGISADVLEQVSELDIDIGLVVVQNARELSNEIERRTGYRHHSPQIFVIRNGEVLYHATHYGIDPLEVVKHLTRD